MTEQDYSITDSKEELILSEQRIDGRRNPALA